MRGCMGCCCICVWGYVGGGGGLLYMHFVLYIKGAHCEPRGEGGESCNVGGQ